MKQLVNGVAMGCVAILALVACGCGSDTDPAMDKSRPAEFGFQQSTEASMLAKGKEAYNQYCVGCHGEMGDGRGKAAGFLNPPPRDFTTAEFKFNSRGVGDLPTNDDLKRTIRLGLKGSAMPAFRLIPEPTLDSLVAYLKTFSPEWEEATPEQPITYVANPWLHDEDKTEAIERGRAVYHGYANCWSCHPAYATPKEIDDYFVMMGDEPRDGYRDTLYEPIPKVTPDGTILYPPDFKRDFVRSGMSLTDLYRSIGAGIQGSAMPKWLESIEYQPDENEDPITTKADIWAMAYYIQDLIRHRPAKLQEGTFDIRHRPVTLYPQGLPDPEAEAEEEEDDDDGYYYEDDEEGDYYEDEEEMSDEEEAEEDEDEADTDASEDEDSEDEDSEDEDSEDEATEDDADEDGGDDAEESSDVEDEA